MNKLTSLVNKQAEDTALWFIARTAAESYLQTELRKLHAAIEEPVPLRPCKMIIVDVETGGLDPERDALLSIAAIDAQTRDEFYSLIRAPESLHISDDALRANGFERKACYSDERESELVVVDKFVEWLSMRDPAIIAGCNVKFDIAFINAAFKRSDIEDRQMLGHRSFDLQTLALVAHLLLVIDLPVKHELPSMSLDSILLVVGLSRLGAVHNALEDAKLTLQAIEMLLNLIRRGEYMLAINEFSTKELVDELQRRKGVEVCYVPPSWNVKVVVESTYSERCLKGGMNDVNTGPCIILKIID